MSKRVSKPQPKPACQSNNAPQISDNSHINPLEILNIPVVLRIFGGMKHFIALLLLTLAFATPGAAHADCYVTYKAKMDSPLRLHYGILTIGGSCPDRNTATRITGGRVAAGGWTLLNVVNLSTKPPSSQQKANAGAYYLRF